MISYESRYELPQIWDILLGNISVIGSRPGLWNQNLLTAERDKYDANDVKPGLTLVEYAGGIIGTTALKPYRIRTFEK